MITCKEQNHFMCHGIY